ncbi:MAG: hypothetical protein CNLJKLNK_00142 [Holosporales bacterium]
MLALKQASAQDSLCTGADFTDHQTAIMITNDRVNHRLNTGESYIFCPMGVFQTASLLGALAEPRIKDETASFVGTESVLQTLFESICSLKSLPTIKSGRDKFELKNALFAFFPKHFTLPEDDDFNGIGAKVSSLDFSDAKNAARIINQYVEAGTNGRIKEIIKERELSRETSLFLLHTIYVNATWAVRFTVQSLNFRIGNETMLVKSFGTSDFSLRTLIQDDQTIFAEIPTLHGSFLLRYNENSVAPISSEEIEHFKKNAQNKKIRYLTLPNLNFTGTYELNKLLTSDLPTVLTEIFNLKKTILGPTDEGVLVSKWTQKVVFCMANTGIDAACVTYVEFLCGSSMPKKEIEKPIEIIVNSPFSFAYFVHNKACDNGNDLIFSGVINTFSPLEVETPQSMHSRFYR